MHCLKYMENAPSAKGHRCGLHAPLDGHQLGELGIVGKFCQAVYCIVGSLHYYPCCVSSARSHVSP